MYNFKGLEYMITGPHSNVLFLVEYLTQLHPDQDEVFPTSNGTSFAVTSDAPSGDWNLHLSKASAQKLISHGVLNNSLINVEEEKE